MYTCFTVVFTLLLPLLSIPLSAVAVDKQQDEANWDVKKHSTATGRIIEISSIHLLAAGEVVSARQPDDCVVLVLPSSLADKIKPEQPDLLSSDIEDLIYTVDIRSTKWPRSVPGAI